jgi:uncharacterized metal-binding protein
VVKNAFGKKKWGALYFIWYLLVAAFNEHKIAQRYLSLVGTCILNHGVETLVATVLFTAMDDSDIVFPPK